MKRKNRRMAVLRELRKDSRNHIAAIARRLGMPTTTAFEAEKKLRQEKIILRCAASIDFEKLGFAIRAIAITKSSRKAAETLKQSPFVNNLQKAGSRYFAELVFRSMRQMATLEEQLGASLISMRPILEKPKAEAAEIKPPE